MIPFTFFMEISWVATVVGESSFINPYKCWMAKSCHNDHWTWLDTFLQPARYPDVLLDESFVGDILMFAREGPGKVINLGNWKSLWMKVSFAGKIIDQQIPCFIIGWPITIYNQLTKQKVRRVPVGPAWWNEVPHGAQPAITAMTRHAQHLHDKATAGYRVLRSPVGTSFFGFENRLVHPFHWIINSYHHLFPYVHTCRTPSSFFHPFMALFRYFHHHGTVFPQLSHSFHDLQ